MVSAQTGQMPGATGSNLRGARSPRRRIVWLILGLILLPLAYFGYREWSARRHYARAQLALASRDFSQARAHLRLCEEIWKSNAAVPLLGARIARASGDLAEADRLLERAADGGADPKSLEFERDLLHAQRGELPSLDITAANAQVIEISLRDPPAEMGQVRDRLLARLEADPGSGPMILDALAQGYLLNERPRSALWCVERLLPSRPDDPKVLVWYGKLKNHYGDPESARQAFERALAADPMNAEGHRGRAELLLRAHQPAEAREEFAWLERNQRDIPAALLGLARCERDLGQPEAARLWLDRLLARVPDHVDGLLERGRLALAAGQPAQAAPWIQRAVTRDPFNRECQYCWYRCLDQQGRRKEGAAALARAEQLAADQRRIEELNRDLASRPHDPGLRREMGRLLLRNGQVAQAVLWLESALQKDPASAETHDALAEYYEQTGNPRLAARHRELAVQLSKNGTSPASAQRSKDRPGP